MTVRIRLAFGISAVVVAISLARAPAAFAQDAMQLDIDFRNSLSQAPHAERSQYEEGRHFHGRHREAPRAEKAGRREKGGPVEAIARR
jgi:hypothetical protein